MVSWEMFLKVWKVQKQSEILYFKYKQMEVYSNLKLIPGEKTCTRTD